MALAAGLGFRPALAAPGRSYGFAVCYPLRKPALRRLAAADPSAAAPPPPPAGEPQPPIQLQGTVQAAPGAEQGWRVNPPLWPMKLITIGACLLSADLAFRRGNPYAGWVSLLTVLFILLPPWSHAEVSLPPVPASQPQPSSQLANQPPNQESTVPQAASGAKKGWDFNPPLWQIKLVTIGALLLFAAFSFQQGNVTSACLDLLVAVVLMLPPWSDSV